MQLSAIKADVTEIETAALVVNLYHGVQKPAGATGAVDAALDGQISELIADGEITGKPGEITIVHTNGPSAGPTGRRGGSGGRRRTVTSR